MYCTPLKPDRLIPVDLLGEIDHPTLTDNDNDNDNHRFNDLFVWVDKEDQSAQKEEKAKDLAAALFRPSRPRANSVACIAEPQKLHVKNDNRADEAQINSTVSLLLTMNYDLSEEAASEAAMVSHADVNLAQHVIFFLII